MRVKKFVNPLLSLLVLGLSHSFAIDCVALASGDLSSEHVPNTGGADPRDWVHFNPYKFKPADKLVPAVSRGSTRANMFLKGAPPFPHDPSRGNVVYGRGPRDLPTEVYAKAFDILQIANKYFQAPEAGESKHIVVEGKAVTIYGTTFYTPLRDNSFVGNPVQVSPFDPSKIYYKDKDMWPSVIYGQPGQEILIAGQRVRMPAAGQTLEIVFDAHGRLKGSSQSSQNKTSDNTSEKPPSGSDNASNKQHSATSGSGSSSTSASSSGSAGSTTADGTGTSAVKTKPVAATPVTEKAAAEKAVTEKAAAEKTAAEKAVTEKAAAEKAGAEKAAAEKAAAEKAAAEKAAAEKAAAEKAAAEKAAAEKAAAEKAAAEKAAAEKAAAEKAAAERAAAEQIAMQTGSSNMTGSSSSSPAGGSSGTFDSSSSSSAGGGSGTIGSSSSSSAGGSSGTLGSSSSSLTGGGSGMAGGGTGTAGGGGAATGSAVGSGSSDGGAAGDAGGTSAGSGGTTGSTGSFGGSLASENPSQILYDTSNEGQVTYRAGDVAPVSQTSINPPFITTCVYDFQFRKLGTLFFQPQRYRTQGAGTTGNALFLPFGTKHMVQVQVQYRVAVWCNYYQEGLRINVDFLLYNGQKYPVGRAANFWRNYQTSENWRNSNNQVPPQIYLPSNANESQIVSYTEQQPYSLTNEGTTSSYGGEGGSAQAAAQLAKFMTNIISPLH